MHGQVRDAHLAEWQARGHVAQLLVEGKNDLPRVQDYCLSAGLQGCGFRGLYQVTTEAGAAQRFCNGHGAEAQHGFVWLGLQQYAAYYFVVFFGHENDGLLIGAPQNRNVGPNATLTFRVS